MEKKRQDTILSQLGAVGLLITTLLGAFICVSALGDIHPEDSGPLGLIEAMPPTYPLGLGVMLTSYGITLGRRRINSPLLTLQLVLVIASLYFVASYCEDVARLPTGWVHAGFIDYIQRHDDIFHNYDARFVWPGFFAFGAMLNELSGTTISNQFLAWAPLVQVFAYALPIWVIARGVGAPIRAAWLATMTFMLLNWVGQDYYSPQGLNMLFALCFFAILIRVFFSASPIVPPWLQALVEPTLKQRSPRLYERIARINLTAGFPNRLEITNAQKASLVGALVLIFTASVASHQLTPFFMIVATAALVILNRLQLRVFPVFMFIGVLAWISFAAAPFWEGKIDQLFGDVGNVGSTLNQNVENRVTGDPAHIPVIYGRLALAGIVWIGAFVGVIRRIRTGKLDIVCVVCFLSPFTILGGQAYGGEAVLRVYLFALPFAATLCAMIFIPREKMLSVFNTAMVCLLLLACIPVFFVTRYGNEAFEGFTSGEYELIEKALAQAPDGSQLLSVNSQLPWRYARIDTLKYFAITDDGLPDDLLKHAEEVVAAQPDSKSIFILSRAQDTYADIVQGKGKHYATDLANTLVETGQWRVSFSNSQGEVVVPVNKP